MNLLHMHLVLNHVPVIGIPLAGAILTWGLLRKERVLERAGLGLLVILAVMAVPVFMSGEPAEEGVENLPGVTEASIDRHQDLATAAISFTEILGVVALAGLVVSRKQKPLPRGFAWVTLGATAIAIGALTLTAYYGGQIRHTEIQAAAPGAQHAEPGEGH